MNAQDIRTTLVEALTRIAPEIDPATIQSATSLREELDLDSMDFLNFVLSVHERLGVEIPEADYARLATLGGAVSYLESKVGDRPTR